MEAFGAIYQRFQKSNGGIIMDFVTFEIAKKLKEKGFNEPCFGWYYASPTCQFDHTKNIVFNHSELRGATYDDLLLPSHGDNINAPTISQVLKWLREEKKIHIGFGYSPRKKWRYVIMYMDDRFYNKPTLKVDGFLNIAQAALAGIEYIIDNLI